MASDPQVAVLRKIKEPESFHDNLLRAYDVGAKDPAALFTVRLLLCGRKKGESAVGPFLESCANEASEAADRTNPLLKNKGTAGRINAVVVDYGAEFIHLLEGPERHIYRYVVELDRAKQTVHDVHILFFDDDVRGVLPSGWLVIDKVPPACIGGDPIDKTDEELADSVLHDMANLRELGTSAGETDKIRRALFADNAKINFPKLFPKSAIIDTYVESEMFLTSSEFEETFCRKPSAPRECEISHPMEDPLKY